MIWYLLYCFFSQYFCWCCGFSEKFNSISPAFTIFKMSYSKISCKYFKSQRTYPAWTRPKRLTVQSYNMHTLPLWLSVSVNWKGICSNTNNLYLILSIHSWLLHIPTNGIQKENEIETEIIKGNWFCMLMQNTIECIKTRYIGPCYKYIRNGNRG